MDGTHTNRFSIRVDGFGRKLLVSGCFAGVILGYLSLVSARFLAGRFVAQPTPLNLQWAIRLDPGNDSYRDIAGEYYLFAVQSPEVAVSLIESAIALNPRQARYWLDLAAADHQLGLFQNEKAELSKALDVDPTTPQVSWEVANAYVSLNDIPAALQHFGTSMSGDPSLLLSGLNYCWRLHPNIDDLLSNVVPNNAEAHGEFLELLISRDENSAADKVWRGMVQSREAIERKHIFAYFEYLINHHEFEKARTAWMASAARGDLKEYQPTTDNLVVNGQFDLPVLNAGLDWRYEKSADVQLSLESEASQSAGRSLKFVFDSAGMRDAGIRQLVPVQPNALYRFSANFRTENLEGAGGPQFVLEDFADGNVLYASEDLRSDAAWRKTEGEFTTGSQTQLLVLHVLRVPAGNAIRGTLCIDDVRLSLLASEAAR
jgi:tetratricopeptide (TPR) repeat protein